MLYNHYDAEDFAADEHFIRWVKTPDHETENFWREWLLKHPQQADVIREAKELVLLVSLDDHYLTGEQVNRIRKNMYKRIGRGDKTTDLPGGKPRHVHLPWHRSLQKIAAVFIALVVCGVLAWYGVNKFSTIEYHTAYGQIQSVQLPDGSSVMLNANSVIRFSRYWNKQHDREVWLEGEAFFDVKHLQSHQKFLVHTREKFTVEVLGTEFNVFERKSGTRVVLQTGKVKLNIGQGENQDQVLMQPGELVELEENTGQYTKKIVNPEQALAWTAHKLIFDNTSIAEVVAVLEENYGLRVHVSGQELLQKKLVGSAPTHDVDIFLSALSKSFNLKIDRKGKEVFIASP